MSRTVPAMLTALVLTLPAMAADNACPLDHTIYEEPFSKTRYVIDEVRFQPGAADAVLVGRMTAHDGSRSSAPIALEIVLANGLVKSGWKEGDAEMVALLESRAPAPQEAMPAPPSRLRFGDSTVFSPRLEDNFGEMKASGCRNPEEGKPGPT
ncbi:MAG: hypothetical protein KDJ73_05485 [Notoacmeibacter sp.]|nr:hypothetical protein [Notoacmeibacter sp.]